MLCRVASKPHSIGLFRWLFEQMAANFTQRFLIQACCAENIFFKKPISSMGLYLARSWITSIEPTPGTLML